jgi:predicted dehydrogenase
MNQLTRKQFLKASLIAGGATLLSRNRAFAIGNGGSPNGDIRIGIIGFNAQGWGHLQNYLPGGRGRLEGAVLTAICDVDDAVLARGREAANKAGIKVAEYKDYRKLLESKDVDAVVCAPPNHQHVIITIAALMAGKDVYIEKPLSHNIWEGRQAVEAARRYSKNVAVIGTQNRSSEQIMHAIEALRSGKYGKLKWVTGTCYKPRDAIGLHDGPQPVPAGLDYDLWSGPAPLVPPTRNGPKGSVHYDWHWFWNYGGGDISNQGIHQMDVGRWMLGAQGMPTSVQSFGGRFGYRDDAETPNTLVSVIRYGDVPMVFEVRGLGRKRACGPWMSTANLPSAWSRSASTATSMSPKTARSSPTTIAARRSRRSRAQTTARTAGTGSRPCSRARWCTACLRKATIRRPSATFQTSPT